MKEKTTFKKLFFYFKSAYACWKHPLENRFFVKTPTETSMESTEIDDCFKSLDDPPGQRKKNKKGEKIYKINLSECEEKINLASA